jgi:hypothetical protein
MRKKPIEERRRFVASVSIITTAILAAIWFVFLFADLPNKFKGSPDADPKEATASVVNSFGGIRGPFEKELNPFSGSVPNLGF